jgi:hypothetical protein
MMGSSLLVTESGGTAELFGWMKKISVSVGLSFSGTPSLTAWMKYDFLTFGG